MNAAPTVLRNCLECIFFRTGCSGQPGYASIKDMFEKVMKSGNVLAEKNIPLGLAYDWHHLFTYLDAVYSHVIVILFFSLFRIELS